MGCPWTVPGWHVLGLTLPDNVGPYLMMGPAVALESVARVRGWATVRMTKLLFKALPCSGLYPRQGMLPV